MQATVSILVGMAKTKDSLDREGWERAALAAIERGGPAAVAVAPLARDLGVTKGSFYWHFETRAELLDGALALWEREHTAALIDRFEAIADPRARLVALIRYSIEDIQPTV